MPRPFVQEFQKALKAIDTEIRKASGICPKCGNHRGGIVFADETRTDRDICQCEQKERADDGLMGRESYQQSGG